MAQRRAVPSHHSKDSIGQFLCPENGYRGALVKKGIQPKNHMRDNVKELKLAEMRNRQKRDDEARPSKPLYKLPQFKDVESRLYDTAPEKENSPRRLHNEDTDNRQFLTKGQSEQRREDLAREKRLIREELERKMEDERQYAERQNTPRKAPVPRPDELALIKAPSNSDFITRNKMNAMTMAAKRGSQDDVEYRHEEYGKVPQYLEDRKAEWAEQEAEQRRRRPDPDCPPGMILMPEAERISTLQVLEQSREEAMQQMRKLPFVIETPSMRKKQDFLEGKLREIDRALGIFSKPKVYVALDR